MWTLVLRAEINEDFTVTKHIHLLQKDVEGIIHTPHTKFQYEFFVEVANVILNENLDVSRYYKEDIEKKLTEEELSNQNVIAVLNNMDSTNFTE